MTRWYWNNRSQSSAVVWVYPQGDEQANQSAPPWGESRSLAAQLEMEPARKRRQVYIAQLQT